MKWMRVISCCLFVATWIACGESLKPEDLLGSSEKAKACRAIADQHYDPLTYILWRDSGNSRFSSIHHALPCSLEIVTGNFDSCGKSEMTAYYDWISRYDQFSPGWDDLVDKEGDPIVSYTQIDSVRSIFSENRVQYHQCAAEFFE